MIGQNFVKYFIRFLGNRVSRKGAFEIYLTFNDIKEELHEEEKNGGEKVLPVPELNAVEFGDTFEKPGLKVRKDLYKKKGTTKDGFFSENAIRFSNFQNH